MASARIGHRTESSGREFVSSADRRGPWGPNFDADAGLSSAVDGVRADIRPIAEDLRSSTTSIRDLSSSSDDLVAQLAALDDDLIDLDQSLDAAPNSPTTTAPTPPTP